MKKLIASIIITLFSLSIFQTAKADGMLVPPPDYMIYETEQKAAIFYDQGIEHLVIQIAFQGNAENFAWIVPTPAQPKIEKSSDSLFLKLDQLTRPEIEPMLERDAFSGSAQNSKEAGIKILETKKIDYYDITVLEAKDKDSLYKWLNDNGYQFPEEGRYVADEYIQKGWTFTAVKINNERLSDSVEKQLASGHAIPLKLSFKTDQVVYPMKISSINGMKDKDKKITENADQVAESRRVMIMPYNPPVGVLLYIFTNKEQDLAGFETQYSKTITNKEIENLAKIDGKTPWIDPVKRKYHLTRLYRNMTTAEMTEDLYPQNINKKTTASNTQTTTVTYPNDTDEFKTIWAWLYVLVAVNVLMVGLVIFLSVKVSKP
jgi:Uncharacterized protein conserved in bacteria (DUF2330)